jgi:hypothetical protein
MHRSCLRTTDGRSHAETFDAVLLGELAGAFVWRQLAHGSSGAALRHHERDLQNASGCLTISCRGSRSLDSGNMTMLLAPLLGERVFIT